MGKLLRKEKDITVRQKELRKEESHVRSGWLVITRSLCEIRWIPSCLSPFRILADRQVVGDGCLLLFKHTSIKYLCAGDEEAANCGLLSLRLSWNEVQYLILGIVIQSKQLLEPVRHWYPNYSTATRLELVVRLGMIMVGVPLGAAPFRYETRLRGDVVDPAEALEFDVFDVREWSQYLSGTGCSNCRTGYSKALYKTICCCTTCMDKVWLPFNPWRKNYCPGNPPK